MQIYPPRIQTLTTTTFLISIWAVTTLAPSTIAQSKPEPVASTRIGDRILEVHAVVEMPDQALPIYWHDSLQFADRNYLKQLNIELGITPWDKLDPKNIQPGLPFGGSKTYVLGLLLLNSDGSAPGAISSTCTAYRAVSESGTTVSKWPTGIESPVQQSTRYAWDYRLTPFIVQIPSGTTVLHGLEGVLLTIPGIQGQIQFDDQKISKQFVGDNNLFAFGLGSERVPLGLALRFGLFTKRTQLKNRKDSKQPASAIEQLGASIPEMQFIYSLVRKDGKSVSPNATSNFSDSLKAQQEIIRDARKVVSSMVKSKKLDAEKVSFFMSDNELDFLFAQLGFNDIAEFDRLQIAYTMPTGGIIPERFVFDKVPLTQYGDKSAINDYVSRLRTASQESNLNSTNSTTRILRTWQDATGKFRVEAKLLEVTEESVKLEKSDGKQISVPLRKLSLDDLQYLDTLK
ncbi:MAG: hypothetical protein FJ308_07880 [Planctomycetes bacterium]|nr:hypothetical protein [Planctomycetota bacterium]